MRSRGNTCGLIVKNITIKISTYIFYRRVFTMARFTLPRDLYHGKGALEALKTFKGKKAMICVGGGMVGHIHVQFEDTVLIGIIEGRDYFKVLNGSLGL